MKGASALPSRSGRSADGRRYSLARRLTDRDRDIALAVERHRVLTRPQVARVFFGSEARARVRLVALTRLGVLDRFQPHRAAWGAHPYHYVLGPEGAALLAAERGEDAGRAARRWRGAQNLALGRAQRLAHLVGVNDVWAALTAAAHTSGGTAELEEWLTEPEAARWTRGIVRPDALGRWREGRRSVEFFLEYDRGTESLGRLADKLADYERFEAERGASSFVAFAFTSPRREHTARRVLAAATVPVATATLLPGSEPQDALWLPVAADGERLRLVALADAPKPAEALRRAERGGPRAWRFDRSRTRHHEEAPIETC